MADNRVQEAVDIVARHALAIASQTAELLDFPEIGEHDWERVEAEIDRLVKRLAPTLDEFEAAYEYLASRAEHDS